MLPGERSAAAAAAAAVSTGAEEAAAPSWVGCSVKLAPGSICSAITIAVHVWRDSAPHSRRDVPLARAMKMIS